MPVNGHGASPGSGAGDDDETGSSGSASNVDEIEDGGRGLMIDEGAAQPRLGSLATSGHASDTDSATNSRRKQHKPIRY